MLISHDYKFIFVRTRKTGGSSTEIALSRQLNDPRDIITPMVTDDEEREQLKGKKPKNVSIPKHRWRLQDWYKAAQGHSIEFEEHMAASKIRRYVGSRLWDRYTTFAVDRNPWDLVVSWYYFRFRPETGRVPEPFHIFVQNEKLMKIWSNWHIYTIDGTVVVDRLFRYDELEESLKALTDELGLPALELPHAKAQYRPGGLNYQELYDAKTKEIVARAFQREIDLFGWSF